MLSHSHTDTNFSLISSRFVQSLSLATTLAASVPLVSALDSPAPPTSHCVEAFETGAEFPGLPALAGADLVGEPGLVVYVQDGLAVVELDGCHYQLNRPLELDFTGLPGIQILFELPQSEGLVEVTVTSELGSSQTLAVEGGRFSYYMNPSSQLALDFTLPGQPAPTVPVIVLSPTRDDPSPSN